MLRAPVRSLAASLVTLAIAPLAAGCGGAMARFPRRPIVWNDQDREPWGPAPEERWIPYYWDAADNLLFRPAAEGLWLGLSEESIDVNAVDEVPDSSFFENRIGRRAMTPEEVVEGPCAGDPLIAPPPWTIIGGKPSGASPGFVIRDANGRRYVLKTDREGQPEQSTGADPVAASVFHAAGYFVPCNRVVSFDPSWLVIEEGATTTLHGSTRHIRPRDVDRVVAAAVPAPDGGRRVVLSRFVDGEALGPWDYVGTWDRDPNDVVPHERRRELRGSYVFDAWLNHWDARQENTLSSWISGGEDGPGYVRHWFVDFGDSLGLVRGPYRARRRLGHATYLDVGTIVVDTLTLGTVSRPWDDRMEPTTLGYYDVEHFDPESWTPQYWNGGLDRRTEHDLAWAARILARFDDTHLAALARLAAFTDPAVERQLVDTLRGRRDRLLERYLSRLSPITDVEIVPGPGPSVCAVDLAVTAGLARGNERSYAISASPAIETELRRESESRLCVTLRGAPPEDGEYVVVHVHGATAGAERREGPLSIHLFRGPGGLELLGLVRTES